jgi:hypothetical protein
MKKRFICLVTVGALLASCASTGPRAKRKAGIGAIMGGLAGGVTAVLQGRPPEEVAAAIVVGGAAGAVVGFTIGTVQDRRLASRDQAVEKYAYDPGQGPLLRVEEIAMDPPAVSPGAKARVRVVYTVLSPGEGDEISVSYANALFHDGNALMDLGAQEASVSQGGGTIEAVFPFSVPKNAPDGTYEFRSDVSISGAQLTDTGSSRFYVQT